MPQRVGGDGWFEFRCPPVQPDCFRRDLDHAPRDPYGLTASRDERCHKAAQRTAHLYTSLRFDRFNHVLADTGIVTRRTMVITCI